MPFALVNASSIFLRFIDHILQGMNNLIVYVNDLIKEHKMPFKLFQRLNQLNIVINQKKLKFGLKRLNFLGHLVTSNKILPLSERVKVVKKYTKPQTCKQCRAYLGFLNYYHH